MRGEDVQLGIQFPTNVTCLLRPQACSSRNSKIPERLADLRFTEDYLADSSELEATYERRAQMGGRNALNAKFAVFHGLCFTVCTAYTSSSCSYRSLASSTRLCSAYENEVSSRLPPSFKPFRSSPPETFGLILARQLLATRRNIYARPTRLTVTHASDNMSAGSRSQDIRLVPDSYHNWCWILHLRQDLARYQCSAYH
ncbi:uncharacterized protein EV420DRAFT_1203766 [Desarmillaria tabescens]|uniref:Uncharacterized protein n=1 Tax=Armillaria tabescens TaxID=1929756 RepID=A0AA39MLA4_ARMTA|nr:uncharacterized protein EV420DRAFT_1203766 [Desarmillaria tabescens]KAK0439036.1 hypothetical protein EV420DRAFT_1203766 [Desarmillaria tabescens]